MEAGEVAANYRFWEGARGIGYLHFGGGFCFGAEIYMVAYVWENKKINFWSGALLKSDPVTWGAMVELF